MMLDPRSVAGAWRQHHGRADCSVWHLSQVSAIAAPLSLELELGGAP
jgi:hypothetical protein